MAGSSYKGSEIKSVDQFISGDGLDSEREKEIGQHIGYRYDVNLLPDYDRLTPFLEEVHRAHGLGRPQLARGRAHGLRGGSRRGLRPQHQWLGAGTRTTSSLPDNQQDRDMIAREMLVKFQMSKHHPMVQLREAYKKF